MVDDEEQYAHVVRVMLDKQESNTPWTIPPPSPPPAPASPSLSQVEEKEELPEDNGEVLLRHPSRLKPSQLTESTYRHYILDELFRQGRAGDIPLSELFPEFTGPGVYGALGDALSVPHLALLAQLTVDAEARRSEKRRRRQHGIESEWRLTDEARQNSMRKLTAYVLRGLILDGCVVETRYGFVAITPELVLALLPPQIEAEKNLRQQIYVLKTNRRWGNGAMIEDLLRRMQSWGDAGRWERMQEWAIKDAAELGVAKGMLQRHGVGYWSS